MNRAVVDQNSGPVKRLRSGALHGSIDLMMSFQFGIRDVPHMQIDTNMFEQSLESKPKVDTNVFEIINRGEEKVLMNISKTIHKA
jgi:hypothetical protein